MKTRTVTILTTMLSLAVANLLVVATNDVILLPSDGGEGLDAGHDVAPEATTRPWKCCDMKVCTKSYLPSCVCLDRVEQCEAACARCVEAPESDSAPSSRVCKDWYHGDPGPRCTATKNGGDDEEGPAADTGEERKKEDDEDAAAGKERKKEDEEPRPWRCCNTTRCTKSFPPTCTCLDLVEECAGACHRCEPSVLDPSRHVCNDQYHGDPGPTCAKDDDHDHDVPSPSGASQLLSAAAQLLFAFVALLFVHSR